MLRMLNDMKNSVDTHETTKYPAVIRKKEEEEEEMFIELWK